MCRADLGYRQLIAEVEELRKTRYDSENSDHEEKLNDLWIKLMPDQKLEGMSIIILIIKTSEITESVKFILTILLILEVVLTSEVRVPILCFDK